MVDKAEKQISEEKETQMSKSSQLVLQIAGAALFCALSIVFAAFVTPFVPRIPGWGIAIIDPVSIIWVMCFLIFGARSGLLCCVLGTFGLMPFDPFAPIGPLMKLSATVALIIVPIMFLKLYKTHGFCPRCDKWIGIEKLTLDHIIPLSKSPEGFDYTINDVQPLCRPCNSSKNDRIECETSV